MEITGKPAITRAYSLVQVNPAATVTKCQIARRSIIVQICGRNRLRASTVACGGAYTRTLGTLESIKSVSIPSNLNRYLIGSAQPQSDIVNHRLVISNPAAFHVDARGHVVDLLPQGSFDLVRSTPRIEVGNSRLPAVDIRVVVVELFLNLSYLLVAMVQRSFHLGTASFGSTMEDGIASSPEPQPELFGSLSRHVPDLFPLLLEFLDAILTLTRLERECTLGLADQGFLALPIVLSLPILLGEMACPSIKEILPSLLEVPPQLVVSAGTGRSYVLPIGHQLLHFLACGLPISRRRYALCSRDQALLLPVIVLPPFLAVGVELLTRSVEPFPERVFPILARVARRLPLLPQRLHLAASGLVVG